VGKSKTSKRDRFRGEKGKTLQEKQSSLSTKGHGVANQEEEKEKRKKGSPLRGRDSHLTLWIQNQKRGYWLVKHIGVKRGGGELRTRAAGRMVKVGGLS